MCGPPPADPDFLLVEFDGALEQVLELVMGNYKFILQMCGIIRYEKVDIMCVEFLFPNKEPEIYSYPVSMPGPPMNKSLVFCIGA